MWRRSEGERLALVESRASTSLRSSRRVNSVLAQTFTDLELVLVDNGAGSPRKFWARRPP